MKIIDKIFGTYSERELKKIEPTVRAIEALEDKYKNMTDEELRATTDALKARLSAGETLDDILPDAFALVREADDRVLSKRPFRVQLIGGIVLHQGRIAEMKTGEGKTLVATLPAYLNALSGAGVHIVTVNEYLARMGYEEMGRVYAFLGLSTGLIRHGQSKEEKRAAYACDITYGTNNEFGFDYLRDNRVIYKENLTQREFNFAIVDEVDSILIDEARTPLIISGVGEESNEMYERADQLVRHMTPLRMKEMDAKEDHDDVDADYIVDEKAENAVLTARGIEKAEKFFGLENYSDPENSEIAHYINEAVHAWGVKRRDVDYIVKDDQVLIVDTFTGRVMPGRRFSKGLHQAIEAKEGVKIKNESKTLATITFQNFFRMYKKLSGMTGTALTEAKEFEEIYALDVVEIPTNKPMIRDDHNDVVYSTVRGKYNAVIAQIKECHAKGQPVLVGTISVDKSEELSRKLSLEGIEHTVLNAKHHEKEAEIVAMAGMPGKVTISTNMAGRGTDIMLGGNPEFMAKQEMRKREYPEEIIEIAVGSTVLTDPEQIAAREVYRELFAKYKEQIEPDYEAVKAAGGLYIIGTERHEARRIDNQLRGRSGRQGDPGESRFFLSLQDDLMRLFGSERVLTMVERLGLGEDEPIDARILSDSIERAQKHLEDENFQRRANVLNYDDVMNRQRTIIYGQRREVLDGMDLSEKIVGMIRGSIDMALAAFLSGPDRLGWDVEGLKQHFFGIIFGEDDLNLSQEEIETLDVEALRDSMYERALATYKSKETLFPPEQMREIERVILLHSVDSHWMDHLDAMDDLRGSIGLQAYAHRDPLAEYQIAAGDMFDEMVSDIRDQTVRGVLSVTPRVEVKRKSVAKVTSEGFEGGKPTTVTRSQTSVKGPAAPNAPVVRGEKVGPNDPCPCGSGKKYKKCCGMNDPEAK